jgi:hypothetical protein
VAGACLEFENDTVDVLIGVLKTTGVSTKLALTPFSKKSNSQIP